jgi:hypothetical protein
VELPAPYAALLGEYVASLDHAPLAASSRAKYVSRVRGYLSWLGAGADELGGHGVAEDVRTEGLLPIFGVPASLPLTQIFIG